MNLPRICQGGGQFVGIRPKSTKIRGGWEGFIGDLGRRNCQEKKKCIEKWCREALGVEKFDDALKHR